MLPLTATTISEAEQAGWVWLALGCHTCTKECLFPLRMLKARTGDQPLASVVPRLRCNVCYDPPATVSLARHRARPTPDYLSALERRPLNAA